MTSLTRAAIIARKTIRYTIYGLLALIIGRFVFQVGIKTYRYLFPEPPPPPTVTYGKIPTLPFPKNEDLPFLEYRLETPDGDLPKLTEQVNIYFMPKPGTDLLSLETARRRARSLGYTEQEEALSETIYRFKHLHAPSVLEINITNNVFSISFDLAAKPGVLENRPPAPENTLSQAKSTLASATLLPDDLSDQVVHEFLALGDDGFEQALSLSEANVTKVHLFRKAYEELPSVTPNPEEANIWFMISGSRERGSQIIAAKYHYFPIDETLSATYPIKSASEAWEELISGNAYIARLESDTEGEVVIRRAYLAYYDPGIPVDFYQPVIVFEGDDGFMAYVPAVTTEFYGE
jgi:hypothetical protein